MTSPPRKRTGRARNALSVTFQALGVGGVVYGVFLLFGFPVMLVFAGVLLVAAGVLVENRWL